MFFGNQLQESLQNPILIGLVFGALLIALGFYGFFAIRHTKDVRILIYFILMTIILVVYVFIGIISISKAISFKNNHMDIENNCAKYFSFLEGMDKSVMLVDKELFCREKCPCNLKSSRKGAVASETGKIRAQDCPNYDKYIHPDIANIIAQFEIELECSGICHETKWYMFTDVNKGVPSKPCGFALIEIIGDYGKIYGLAILTVAVLMAIKIIGICCLCMHHRRKESIYFIQDDDENPSNSPQKLPQ